MRLISRTLLGLAALVAGASVATAQAPTWAIVVRHAEKAATPGNDPDLSPEGAHRAVLLMQRLASTPLDAIIVTQFKRTQQTAATTATTHRVPLTIVSTTVPNHVQAVADEVRKHAGKVVLVVGHSNTVPEIVEALGAPKPKAICDAEYDGFYIVSIPASGKATVVETRYGAPSVVDAGCASIMK